MSLVDEAYWRAIDAMTGTECVARTEALFHMGREMLKRRVRAELGESISEERLKWEVALRMYESEPIAKLIRKKLAELGACSKTPSEGRAIVESRDGDAECA